ncbi:hypothetical protein GCM10009560_35260 [Nonomuraea longicatena]|uniref:Uncharacterized protein n=1 Tax=Nonomuraea longicatena TaxID=83682 RepID=A0ABN1PP45_9ACTN
MRPQRLGQGVDRDETPRVEREQGQQRPQASTADPHGPTVGDHLQRSEDAYPHDSPVPDLSPGRSVSSGAAILSPW